MVAIEAGNAAGKNPTINIKGFAVGNGYTDWQLDFNANVENGRFHALTSQTLFDAADEACNGSFARCFWPRDDVECPSACDYAVGNATKYAENGEIDIYDIYVDVCLNDENEIVHNQMSTLMAERTKQRTSQRGRRTQTTISPVFDTCVDNFAAKYLNTESVRRWLNIRDETVPNGKWADCQSFEYDFNYASEIPNYVRWAQEGALDILIYNGDADFILSHMGNSAWVSSLNLPKEREWTQWKGSDQQVAGYFEQYTTKAGSTPLTFLTVKGAGHMVPKDRPGHALDMFNQFLNGGTYDQVQPANVGELCPQSSPSSSSSSTFSETTLIASIFGAFAGGVISAFVAILIFRHFNAIPSHGDADKYEPMHA